MRCAYCGRSYLYRTFLVSYEACCTDCLPYKGWPASFRLFLPVRLAA